jgi:hypothetical protein
MFKVFREHGYWKALQRANRNDCVLLFNDKEMAKGDKPHILKLFNQFSQLGEMTWHSSLG